MQILLPPSEGKADSGSDGPALDVASLGFTELTKARERVLSKLLAVSKRRNALDILGLSKGQAGELERNLALRTAPTLTARELYTGVLYDNLGLPSLDVGRQDLEVLIFSGLWGVVRPGDRIPPYRLSIGVQLPLLGGLGAFWRPHLTKALRSLRDELLVDMRSGPYMAAWPASENCVAVRVFRESEGKRTVVSHMAKATRGEVARTLLQASDRPSSPVELAELVDSLGYVAELSGRPNNRHSQGKPWTLDIVTS